MILIWISFYVKPAIRKFISVCYILQLIYICTYVPYKWYIWRTLSLAIRQQNTDWRTFSLADWPKILPQCHLKIVLVVTLVWRFKIKPPNRQIKITVKCTTYTVCMPLISFTSVINLHKIQP